MSEPVAFISRFRIKAGQRPAYEALAADATPRLQAQKPQTLVFLSYVGDEELLTIIHVFADAESTDRHFEGSDERSAQAMPLLIPLGWEIYGSVSEAALATLKRVAATAGVPLAVHGEFLGGFLRQHPVSDEPPESPVGALLGLSLVSRELQQAFLAAYLARQGSADDFWQSLEEDERFSSEGVRELRLTLLLGRLTGFRLPIYQQLQRLRDNGQVRDVRDIARLDQARWRRILRAAHSESGAALPQAIPGDTPQDRLEHIITTLRAALEQLFPSDSLRHALRPAPETEPKLSRIIPHADDLELYWRMIDDYLRE